MKRKAEEDEYLGEPLSKEQCDKLRKTLYLKQE
jgi:hypothetical protein